MEQNQNEIQRISLLVLLDDFLREARRLLVWGILIVILFSAGITGYRYKSFVPQYEAYASFTVRVANPMYASVHIYNTTTAEQMAKTFPYILTSGVLQERVQKRLDISFLPSVSASVMPNSNIFTLRVRDTEPERAHEVLNAVIECYPEISDFVVGPTVMVLLDESGVPTSSVNSFSAVGSLRNGAVMGLAVWAAFVLVIAMTKSTVHSEEELKTLLNFTCLGLMPMSRVSRKHHCPLLHETRDQGSFGESVRLLRLRLEKMLNERGKNILLISSAIPGEGKTTVSVNLAISLAQRGKKVLLIDCDLRNPSVARALRMQNREGMAEYLCGKVSAQGLIGSTRVENLSIITGGVTGKAGNHELLSNKRAGQLIKSCSKIYDYVILDTPPCSLLADASEIAAVADCALVVIRQDFASQDQILDGVQSLVESGLPLLGCVLNGIESGIGTGYGYGYGYGYGHGYGYGSYGGAGYGNNAKKE